MAHRPLIVHLFPAMLLITFTALGAAFFYASLVTQRAHSTQVAHDLDARILLLQNHFEHYISLHDVDALDAWAKKVGQQSGTRITVISEAGKVVGDSHFDQQNMEDHGDRPEVFSAFADGMGKATRFSSTLQEMRMYAARQIKDKEGQVAVLRLSLPVTEMNVILRNTVRESLLGAAVILVFAALLAWFMAKRITRPVAALQIEARKFSQGNLTTPLPTPTISELADLAHAMNDMALQLNERIALSEQQRNQLQAMWSSMSEGVLAFDMNRTVLQINPAASLFFKVDIDKAQGQNLREVVHNPILKDMVIRILHEDTAIEGEVTLKEEQVRHLHCRGAVLRDADGTRLGGLLVLNDITQLRGLENSRKEFVDNVSHEIRSPITAIRGYAETVLELPEEDREDRQRFLGIIMRQAKRLTALVEDVLALASIERQQDDESLAFDYSNVNDLLESATSLVRDMAQAKKIEISVFCDDHTLKVPMDRPLLEQALLNLLTNAIRYSADGKPVILSAMQHGEQLEIQVEDQGPGIDPEHFPRLFERFYRVDKARSRQKGGTGLGLAIVKHIVILHQGEVRVTSTPGKGSTFTLILPNPPEDL